MELDIVFYTWMPRGGRCWTEGASLNRQHVGSSQQSNQTKGGKKSSLCDVSLLPLTPREGDVICRRSAQWPVCRLEWTRPRIIDSGAALKCWLSTTYPRSPRYNHRILPDCWLVYVEEEVFDPGRNPSREFSVILLHYHLNSRPLLLRCSCKRWWGFGVGELFIITPVLVKIFLVSWMQTLLPLISAFCSCHVTQR